MKVKITLTNCGTTGLLHEPVELDPDEIMSIVSDPVAPDAHKCVVTMNDGTWFLVSESMAQIEALTEAAEDLQ